MTMDENIENEDVDENNIEQDWRFSDWQGDKMVNGYLEDEVEIIELSDSSAFSNCDICEHLGSYFHFFGSRDMDIIFLYFLSKKRQEELVDILEKTQPAISYDVNRIRHQIDFVVKMVSFVDAFVFFIVDENNGLTTREKEILIALFFSNSLLKTSKILGMNNITCRSHIFLTIRKLKQLGYIEQHDFFLFIFSNLNKVKKNLEEDV